VNGVANVDPTKVDEAQKNWMESLNNANAAENRARQKKNPAAVLPAGSDSALLPKPEYVTRTEVSPHEMNEALVNLMHTLPQLAPLAERILQGYVLHLYLGAVEDFFQRSKPDTYTGVLQRRNDVLSMKQRIPILLKYINETIFPDMHTNPTSELKLRHMDQYYAKMVAGASVSCRLETVWVQQDATGDSEHDRNEFHRLKWQVVGRMMRKSDPYMDVVGKIVKKYKLLIPTTSSQTAPRVDATKQPYAVIQEKLATYIKSVRNNHVSVQEMRALGDGMRLVQQEMKGVWQYCKSYRVSLPVHMIEVELFHRLRMDRALPKNFANEQKVLECCLYMRRSPAMRGQFAQAVGKRLLSTRSVTSQRAQIIEHRRATDWAEREYISLAAIARGHAVDRSVVCDDYTHQSDGTLGVEYAGKSVVAWELISHCNRVHDHI
jgi:hypothetical protein